MHHHSTINEGGDGRKVPVLVTLCRSALDPPMNAGKRNRSLGKVRMSLSETSKLNDVDRIASLYA
jgi:hypothetical protein